MPRTIEIDCPDHHVRETLTLPDSYSGTFEGEIPCGAKDEKATLRIKLTGEGNALRVVKLRVVKPFTPKLQAVKVNVTSGGKRIEV